MNTHTSITYGETHTHTVIFPALTGRWDCSGRASSWLHVMSHDQALTLWDRHCSSRPSWRGVCVCGGGGGYRWESQTSSAYTQSRCPSLKHNHTSAGVSWAGGYEPWQWPIDTVVFVFLCTLESTQHRISIVQKKRALPEPSVPTEAWTDCPEAM